MTYRKILRMAALVAGCAAATGHAAAAPDAGEPSVLVTLTALRQGSLPRTVDAYGNAQAAPAASRSVTASTSATVTALYVQQGEAVAAGTPLLQLTPDPQTAAAYAQAETALRVADDLAARTAQLFAGHLATAQQNADARQSASDARANLAALKAQGAAGRAVLRAPFRAIVLRVSASPGMRASAGTPLLDLAKPDGVVLTVGVTPARAALVARGNTARVTAVGDTRSWPATVLQRGAMIDPAMGLVPVTIASPDARLLPGEAAEATITVGETHGYVVPHAAILVDERGEPYVVQANGMKARKVAVQIAGTQGNEDVIRGAGLNAAQPLVLSGNYQLDDGMRMRVAAPRGQEAK